jgi:L-Ala-D/L-Glu epimerase
MISSGDALSVRPLVRLALRASDGIVGYGEAAPLSGYDRVTIADVELALRDCRPALTGDGHDREAVLAHCSELTTLPQALAAIDLALWDLTGKRAGRPVWQLLGESAPVPVEVNATIGAEDRSSAARQAAAAREAGFATIKVKVGVGDDAGRLAATRAAAGRDMQIRIDANGAWSVDEAIAALRALAATGIECCEEPVHGLGEIAQVAEAVDVALSLDESAADPGALDSRVCDAVCLKIARCGGITGLLRDARRAREAGYEVYIASTLDGPLGIAAALHAACVVRPDRACGLATLALFDQPDPFPPRGGMMIAPPGPGLGLG